MIDTTPRNNSSSLTQQPEKVKKRIVEGVAQGRDPNKIAEVSPVVTADLLPEADTNKTAMLEALKMVTELVTAGHVHGMAVAFALAPEHAGKVIVHGHLHQTLAGTCLNMANVLSAEPFMHSERKAAEAMAAQARADNAKPEAVK